MANPNPVIRNEAQELLRQINFTKTLKARVYIKAEKKAKEYEDRITELEAKLEAVRVSQ